ncbi:acyl-CoA thioesterase [Nocardioides insulae]|uniref:acyl-CoA thioesterase n=1 Tax=Nocardioides insulae TaxID=394734 RepID=UPI00041B1E57|nr:acyl-CoA thioesterase domain-containing protein [Nocardioides insulae]
MTEPVETVPEVDQDGYGPLGRGDLMTVRPVEGGFLGRPHEGRPTAAYGGAVLGQALMAARATVPIERRLHSLHCYFLAAVSPTEDAFYDVQLLRDGRSYANRRVEVRQGGAEVATLQCSYADTAGRGRLTRQPSMPDVPGPEDLRDGFWFRDPESHIRGAMECREAAVRRRPEEGEVEKIAWFRTVGRLPDDPGVHEAALAYLSDVTLSPTALLAHGITEINRAVSRTRVASLDHAMWFHHACRADEWLLYRQRSVLEGESRALAHGEFYDRSGRLVASTAQESVVVVPPGE